MCSNASAIVGLKWKKAGADKKKGQRVLVCDTLALALQRQLTLTAEELSKLDITDLRKNPIPELSVTDTIWSADSYYEPIAPDTRVWSPGPLTTCARSSWNAFRYALGHHLLGHPRSPYDEVAGAHTKRALGRVLPKIDHPPSPVDPLFDQPITGAPCVLSDTSDTFLNWAINAN